MYTKTTDGIRVTVVPFYLEEQSSPEEEEYIWLYTIRIENLGHKHSQILARHWEIFDKYGRKQELDGIGVIGKQPVAAINNNLEYSPDLDSHDIIAKQPIISPGKSYEYTSATYLKTPSGIMRGKYQVSLGNEEVIDVEIPAFSLDSPYEVVLYN